MLSKLANSLYITRDQHTLSSIERKIKQYTKYTPMMLYFIVAIQALFLCAGWASVSC